jgi:hypothetical protein
MEHDSSGHCVRWLVLLVTAATVENTDLCAVKLRNMSLLFSRLKCKQNKKPAELRPACHLLMLVSYLAYTSALKMEVISSFETSGSLQTAQENRQSSAGMWITVLGYDCVVL